MGRAAAAITLLCALAFAQVVHATVQGAESVVVAHPEKEMKNWLVEQMPGGTVAVRDGVLEIEDKDGCTVWLCRRLHAPVEISYEAMVVNEGKPGERTSDLNCFWMARDPRRPDDLFAAGHGRTGKFSTYDTLATYYAGCGGNNNTTTRFRRYTGNGKRPLLPEHDLSAAPFLLKPNRWYKIRLTAAGGVATFSRDGELVFTYRDDAFLDSGWFGIRTVASHLRIRNVRIKSRAAKQ
jgi:hypothetical protein